MQSTHRAMLSPLKPGQRGSVVIGLMIGVLLGLAMAVAVAIFVTRAPLPFVNKATRGADRPAEPKSAAEAPDPNRALSSRSRGSDSAGQPRAAGEVQTPAAGASLPPPADVGSGNGDSNDAPDRPAPTEAPLYALQVGAFRMADDAESMKGKLALIGLEARVLPAEVNGQRVYRVRIGPYSRSDDVTRAKARLEENGIEASVVRSR
jgi:cell division protein FtsN